LPPGQGTTTPSPSSSHPFLFQGATGPAVTDLQQRLTKLGLYSGPISGTYSPDTAGAVVALQRKAKLSRIDGGMQAPDWAALEQMEKAAPAQQAPAGPAAQHPDLHFGSQGADVSALQQRLAKAGFNPGVADGVYGAATMLAVSALQRRASVQPTSGAMDEATWAALERLENSAPPASKNNGPGHVVVGPSDPTNVNPPTSARLRAPGWDSGLYKHGDQAVLFCDAPNLNGRAVQFFVQSSKDHLSWADYQTVPGVVKNGVARTSVPVANQSKAPLFLRFRVEFA
jgi:peptidoglycan hydrolase-like protein with peptidoglycan-binding domain